MKSLFQALRHDAEIVAGVRHNEDRILHGTRFGEGVLKLIEAVESTEVEVMHKLLMERVPTGDPARYSTHRSLWELAKRRREAAFAYLGIPPDRAQDDPHEAEVFDVGWHDEHAWKAVCSCGWEIWNCPTEASARLGHSLHTLGGSKASDA